MYTDPFVSFIIVLLIGIAAGLIFDRFVGSSWVTRALGNSQRRMITSWLVGIAGAFIGYHTRATRGRDQRQSGIVSWRDPVRVLGAVGLA